MTNPDHIDLRDYFEADDTAALRRLSRFLHVAADHPTKGWRRLLGRSMFAAVAGLLDDSIIPELEEQGRRVSTP